MSGYRARHILPILLLSLFGLLLTPLTAWTVPASPRIIKLHQDDGTAFQARRWGDESMHGWETRDGYTILFDRSSRNWHYAEPGEQGRLKSSGRRVGLDAPPATQRKGLRPAPGVRAERPDKTIDKPVRTRGQGRSVAQASSTDQADITARLQATSQSGSPGATLPLKVLGPGPANPAIVLPVILVNFADTAPRYARTDFNNLLFGSGNYSLRDYYAEVSYGQLSVTGGSRGVLDWVTASQPHAYYGANDGNDQDTWPGDLVYEAVASSDPGVDFAEYDSDGDCFVDVLAIAHQGTGEEAGVANDIWSHSWNLLSAEALGYSHYGIYTTDDVCPSGGFIQINDYVIQPELYDDGLTTVGVYAHEFGHALGLPDLYDRVDPASTWTSYGPGVWSLMASGSWLGQYIAGDRPSHLDPWSKTVLGFVTPTRLSSDAPAQIFSASALTPDIYQILDGDAVTGVGEYFLLENRHPFGFDAGLPGSGLLVWHIDEAIDNNDSESWPDCGTLCDGGHYKVGLVQADGHYQLEQYYSGGDAGDPFPGSTRNSSLSGLTAPDNRLYDGSDSGFYLENISGAALTMSADVRFAPASQISLGEALEQEALAWTTHCVDMDWGDPCSAGWIGQADWSLRDGDAAMSGLAVDAKWISMQTTVTGPGTLSFSWKVSSEEHYDWLVFYLDAAEQARISGELDWHQRSFAVPAGAHVLRWEYAKDWIEFDGLDNGWVDDVRWVPGVPLGAALEASMLEWTVHGDGSWQGSFDASAVDGDAAAITALGAGQDAALATFVDGPGTLAFAWQISSTSGLDRLQLLVDGEPALAPISGEVPWRDEMISLPAGRHALQWVYARTSASPTGDNRAGLDHVRWSPDFDLLDSFEPDGSAATATPLLPGVAQHHTFAPSYDIDYVRYDVKAGNTYIVETKSTIAPLLFFYEADGTTLETSGYFGYGEGDNPRRTWKAYTDETLYLQVLHPAPAGSGDAYELHLTEIPADTCVPPNYLFVSANSSDGTVRVTWPYTQLGVTYVVEEATDAAFTQNRQTVFSGTSTYSQQLSGRTPGQTYYYRIKTTKAGLNDSSWRYPDGSCTVTIQQPDDYETDNTIATASQIANGATQQRTTAPLGDQDWVAFDAVAGWRYQVDSISEATALRFDLYATNGLTRLVRQDDSLEGLHKRIDWLCPASGTYYLHLKSDNAALQDAYTLTLNGNPPQADPPPSISVPAFDADGNYTVQWVSSPTPAVTYTLEEAERADFSGSVQTVFSGTAAYAYLTGRSAGQMYYYRLRASRAGMADSPSVQAANGCLVGTSTSTDRDGDGVSNAAELLAGSNPDNPDSDGDGVPDGLDLFVDDPTEWADSDSDGLGDNSDPCPLDALNDLDGDSVCGNLDLCPGFDDRADADGDGLPDACDPCANDAANDGDGDGLCADVDNCPGVANPAQWDTDWDGFGLACDTLGCRNPRISAGFDHTVALGADGTTLGAGDNSTGELDIAILSGASTVSAGYDYTLGLMPDGTVLATGLNSDGQLDVLDWTDIVAISAAYRHSVGLTAMGTAVAVGLNTSNQLDVSAWTDLVAVAAGENHTLGLKANGTVVATGDNSVGQNNVEDWTNIVAVAAGAGHSVGLRQDGTVVAAGSSLSGQTDVGSWSNVVAISAGHLFTVGLRNDGTLLICGDNTHGQFNATSWSGVVAVDAGHDHVAGILAEGSVMCAGLNASTQGDTAGWKLGLTLSDSDDDGLVDNCGEVAPQGLVYNETQRWYSPAERTWVRWGRAEHANALYELEAAYNDGPYSKVYTGTRSDAAPLVSIGTYTYRIRTLADGFPPSSWVYNGRDLTVTGMCDIPGRLNVPTAISTDTLTLGWGRSLTPNANYDLEMDCGSGFSSIYSGADTAHTATGLTPGTCSFRVRATNPAEGYLPSIWRLGSNVLKVVLPVDIPGELIVRPWSTDGSNGITWKPSLTTGARYDLQTRYNGGAWSNLATDLEALSFAQTGLLAGAHEYRVRANINGIVSPWRYGNSVTSVNFVAEIPAWIGVRLNKIYWAASATTGATYTLEAFSAATGTWSGIYSGPASEHSAALPPGAYKFRVRAEISGGAPSAWKPTQNWDYWY